MNRRALIGFLCACALPVGCLSNTGSERDSGPGAADDGAEPDGAVCSDGATDTRVEGADAADVVEPEGEPGLAIAATTEGTTAPFVKIHATIAWQGHAPSDIVNVRWTVIPPVGSPHEITGVTSVHVEANLVGPWRVRAVIVDRDGVERVARSFTIQVAPPIGLYVQLSWRTPGDINENDTGGDQIYFSVGSDVDLHLLHPKAQGVFFDWTYDTYWDNTQPEWGIFDPLDNPSLDRDDTDGAGPEAISLARPEPDAAFTVGVHYWNDWGYGNAWATVRIYVDGELADEWAEVELRNDDLWTSHRIVDGVVQRVGGGQPAIAPNYHYGDELQPAAIRCSPEIVRTVPGRVECTLQGGTAAVSAIRWTVTDPSGNESVVAETATLATNLGVPGLHSVVAALLDSNGQALETLSTRVLVTDQADQRLTLVWHTPGDPDPDDVADDKSDAAGADLDLHLLHANAEALGDFTYDCNYDNPSPEWGIFGPLDNPAFAVDDFDGIGPETITLAVPEAGVPYRVLVHAFHDHGFGPSTAAVRLYMGNALVGRAESPPLSTGDTWEAMTIIDGAIEGGGLQP